MPRKIKRRATRPRNRAGLLPNEYKKRSLVSVEVVQASTDPNPFTFMPSLTQTKNYVVSSHRRDSQWLFTIEHNGVRWDIPGAVYDALARQRAAIIKEAARHRAQDRWESTLRDRSQQEQDEAEQERIADLAGL